MTSFKRAFITGCDENTEWMLDWFLKNYKKHNTDPIVFVDFGVSEETRMWAHTVFDEVVTLQKQTKTGWFYKPAALLQTGHIHQRVWLDTDIEVLGDLSGIWRRIELEKLAMVEDRPWSKRRGETWHNSGVVGVMGTPSILQTWYEQTLGTNQVGDQEVLHEMLRRRPIMRTKYITDLPNRYNWLRLQVTHDGQDSPQKLCMHWTGEKGKNEIRKQIYNG